jgi:hypothetical protein
MNATFAAITKLQGLETIDTGEGIALICNLAQYGQVPVETVLDGTATPVHVVLSQDGRRVDYSNWHEGPAEDAEWVFYERWTPEGRRAHGWVHSVSRKLLQSG